MNDVENVSVVGPTKLERLTAAPVHKREVVVDQKLRVPCTHPLLTPPTGVRYLPRPSHYAHLLGSRVQRGAATAERPRIVPSLQDGLEPARHPREYDPFLLRA